MFTLLIVGATGLVGSEVLRLAKSDPRITHVVAVTRKKLAPHPKMENPVVDFNALPADAPWWRVNGVACALGTTRKKSPTDAEYHLIDVDYPVAFAKLAFANGATAFSHTTSLGASTKSASTYLRMKGEVEMRLAEVGFSSLTIVRPSFIAGVREPVRPLESIFFTMLRAITPILPKRLRPISATRIAHALIESVVNPTKGVTVRESETL